MAGRTSPDLRIVIDHLGKPPCDAAAFERWAGLLARAAAAPNVFAKISGLDAGRGPSWAAIDVRAAVAHALVQFSAQRLMCGSDWPVANLRGGYAKVWQEAKAVLAAIATADKDRVFGGTAVEVYRLARLEPV